jgi:hypothetical protein
MVITKRLSRNDYNRPAKTYQDTLSNTDIKDKLKDYKKVNDMSKISISTHLRYFTKDKNGNQLFRLGGVLTKIDPELRYVILSNGSLSWSVQIKNSTFFQKMSEKEVRDEIKKELTEEQSCVEEYNELKKKIKTLTNKFETLENNYENLENEYKKVLKKNNILESEIKKIETEIIKEKNKEKNKKK